jgi:hypothetical protein
MPNVTVDADVEVDEFLESCSSREIQEVIEWLKEEGELKPNETPSNIFVNDGLKKISDNFFRLTVEEEEIIKQIADRL